MAAKNVQILLFQPLINRSGESPLIAPRALARAAVGRECVRSAPRAGWPAVRFNLDRQARENRTPIYSYYDRMPLNFLCARFSLPKCHFTLIYRSFRA